MKKLLAIAVAAAFAAPMIASADVTVGGNLNMEYDFSSGSATNKVIVDDGGDNEITIRASTPLDNGMTGTASINHEFNASGNAGDSPAAHTNGKLGIKGGFGHVTIGAVSKPMDAVDGTVGFLPSDFSYADGTGNQGINYTGAFGGITAMALVRPRASTATTNPGQTENQVGLNYKAGPFAAGLGLASGSVATDSKTRLALAYNGGNYSVGAQLDKAEGGAKATVLGGKYSFGKAYVSASVAKKAGAKGNAVKLGYALGKSTEVYLSSAKGVGSAGLVGDGVAATSRTNKIGINQKF